HKSKNKQTQLTALETLGKLGLYYPDKEIYQIAASGSGGMQAIAQWVMSNSGDPKELSTLAQFLFSSDSTQIRYAAYALRFKDELPPKIYGLIKNKYQTMKKNNPFRVYLIGALWIHAPPEEEDSYKKELL